MGVMTCMIVLCGTPKRPEIRIRDLGATAGVAWITTRWGQFRRTRGQKPAARSATGRL